MQIKRFWCDSVTSELFQYLFYAQYGNSKFIRVRYTQIGYVIHKQGTLYTNRVRYTQIGCQVLDNLFVYTYKKLKTFCSSEQLSNKRSYNLKHKKISILRTIYFSLTGNVSFLHNDNFIFLAKKTIRTIYIFNHCKLSTSIIQICFLSFFVCLLSFYILFLIFCCKRIRLVFI